MSRFWNSRAQNLSPYVPGEQPRDRQFIKLNTNENPYPPSPKVIEAIKKAADASLRLYPDPACTELREAIAARYGVRAEQVFAGNGSDEVLAFAFGAFFESASIAKANALATATAKATATAEPILFPDITYSFYPVYANLWDIPHRVIPLDEHFSITINDYKVPSGGVVLPNPNAPTGMALPLSDILSLAEYLEKMQKVFILDEAYIAFSDGAHTAVPPIVQYPNVLTVHTLSKSSSLAGLRAGFAIGSEELIEGLCRLRDSFNSYTMDRLALAGAAAAVSDAAYYDEINRRVVSTRTRVVKTLHDLGCTVLPSAANFIFMKGQGISGVEFFAALRRQGILVRHFNKERIGDFLRVSMGTDEEMDAFLDACKKVLNRKQGASSDENN